MSSVYATIKGTIVKITEREYQGKIYFKAVVQETDEKGEAFKSVVSLPDNHGLNEGDTVKLYCEIKQTQYGLRVAVIE